MNAVDRPVIGRLHEAQLPLDPACHDIGVDRHEGMGDHHVDGQAQLVEHQAVGLGRIVLHREDHAELVAHGAIGERDGRSAKGDASIGHVLGDHADARPREERVFLARVERAKEAQKLAGAGSKQAGLQLIEGRQEKPHDLVELAQHPTHARPHARDRSAPRAPPSPKSFAILDAG